MFFVAYSEQKYESHTQGHTKFLESRIGVWKGFVDYVIRRFVLIDALPHHLLHVGSTHRLVAPTCLEQPCLREFLFGLEPSVLIPVPKIAVLLDSAKDIAPHPGLLEICGQRLDDQRIFG